MNPTSKNRFVPQFDTLEDRACPSSIRVLGPIMLVNGDSGADTVIISDDGNGTVSATIDGNTVTRSNIKSVIVRTGDGADNVTYSLTGNRNSDFALLVNLGRGADSANIGLGAFNVNATLAIGVNGGNGGDTIGATYTGGQLNGKLGIALAGGSGVDNVAATIDLAAGSGGDLGALVSGGSSNDIIGLAITGATSADVEALLDGGKGGGDTGTHTANVTSKRVENDTVV